MALSTKCVKIIKIGQKLWHGEPFQYFKTDFLSPLFAVLGGLQLSKPATEDFEISGDSLLLVLILIDKKTKCLRCAQLLLSSFLHIALTWSNSWPRLEGKS